MSSSNGNRDDTTARELAAVEAALAGTPVDPQLGELGELARALRAERPRPRPEFTALLDARARNGFPQDVQARRPSLRTRFPRRRLQLTLASAASLFIVVTAVVSSGVLGGGAAGVDERSPDAPVTLEQPAREAGRGGADALAPSTERSRATGAEPSIGVVPPAPVPDDIAPRERRRQIERQAAITLAAPVREVETVADEVIAVTDRNRGFVLRSVVSGGEDGRAGATFDLRIPSDRLQPALRDLSALAHVRARTQTADDVTASFVLARARLREALAERRGLLRQLARAVTPNETASIRARLRLANRQIAAARRELRSVRRRVDLSAVSVVVEADDGVASKDGSSRLGAAVDSALDVLVGVLGVAIVALAVLVPVLALAGVGWLATRRALKARRERALDPPTAAPSGGSG